MANEISYQFQTVLNNGELSDSYSSGSLAADQSTAKVMRSGGSIGTVAAGDVLGGADLTELGLAVFKNLDDTNFVEVGVQVGGTFYGFAKLEPGEAGVVRLVNTNIYARADTADVELFYIVYNN